MLVRLTIALWTMFIALCVGVILMKGIYDPLVIISKLPATMLLLGLVMPWIPLVLFGLILVVFVIGGRDD